MARYDAADLCDKIRKIEAIPASSNTFTNDDLTEILNMELQSYVVPVIQKVREEYFVVTEQHVLNGNTITIPPEAIGLRLRDVAVWDEAQQSLQFIPKLNPEELNAGNLYGYTLRNDKIVFNSVPSGVTISLSYYKRPNDLTNTEYVTVLTKAGSNQVTVTGMPATWVGTVSVDVIGKQIPFVGKSIEVSAVVFSATTLTLPADVYATIEVGDFIATSGFSPVPQYIPVEAHALLVQSAALRCLQSLGDREGWKVSSQKLGRLEMDLISLITPRVESQYKKIVNNRNLKHFM